MIAVMIVPTGIGAAIGGHAGDATPAAKLLASVCDKLILHPNVVNASDINEMPSNALYVEGSILDRLLEGKICLTEVRQNRILVVVNDPVRPETINAVSAARATIGADISICVLRTPLKMVARNTHGVASGEVFGWKELVEQVRGYDFDALAIATPIECDKGVAIEYFRTGGINPWGGVEALASRLIADKLDKPVAHAPIESEDAELKTFNEVVEPRIAAEMISMCYLHSVLKGLHKAPRIGRGPHCLGVNEVDVLVSPWGCYGRPHRACSKFSIPIMMVHENQTCLDEDSLQGAIRVENYLEAAGVLAAMKAGVSREAVRRPLQDTLVITQETQE